jgi:hypothetical protein
MWGGNKMKKLLVLFVALAMIASVSATSGSFTSGWAPCNTAGNYGGFANSCFVAWDGVTQACTENNRDADFTVGTPGMTTTMISIDHLNGISDNDGFEVKDGSTVLCTVPDVATSSETWSIENCAVNFDGIKTLTIHPTADAWSDCATWGQVAVKDITFEAAPVKVDFGPCTGDLITGWGIPAIAGGVYGGEPYNKFCLVWEPTCADNTNSASAKLAFGAGDKAITIRHLDGLSNYDSFDVLVDNAVVGHYKDVQDSTEKWVTTNFPVTVTPGVHTVTIKVTDSAWASCDSWGQLAISNIGAIPEFGVIAGVVALVGALGIFLYRRH